MPPTGLSHARRQGAQSSERPAWNEKETRRIGRNALHLHCASLHSSAAAGGPAALPLRYPAAKREAGRALSPLSAVLGMRKKRGGSGALHYTSTAPFSPLKRGGWRTSRPTLALSCGITCGGLAAQRPLPAMIHHFRPYRSDEWVGRPIPFGAARLELLRNPQNTTLRSIFSPNPLPKNQFNMRQ